MSRFLVIGAPSGAGKTTLLHLLLARQPGLRFSVSHTTRPIRPGEAAGKDYHFVSREEFDRALEAGEFLEWAEVYGNRYGTHRSEVETAGRQGKDLVLDLDAQGARSVRAELKDAAFVLIVPPTFRALEERLRTRGSESEETIRQRLALAREQIAAYPVYDYLVVNDDRERACTELEAILVAERRRLRSNLDVLERLLAVEPTSGAVGPGTGR